MADHRMTIQSGKFGQVNLAANACLEEDVPNNDDLGNCDLSCATRCDHKA